MQPAPSNIPRITKNTPMHTLACIEVNLRPNHLHGWPRQVAPSTTLTAPGLLGCPRRFRLLALFVGPPSPSPSESEPESGADACEGASMDVADWVPASSDEMGTLSLILKPQ